MATMPLNPSQVPAAVSIRRASDYFSATKGATLYPTVRAQPQLLEQLHSTLAELEIKRLQERICEIVPVELSIRYDTKLGIAVAQRQMGPWNQGGPLLRPIPWPLDPSFASRLQIIERMSQAQGRRPHSFDHVDTMELLQQHCLSILDVRVPSGVLVDLLAMIKRLFLVTRLQHIDVMAGNRAGPSFHTYIFTPGVRQAYSDKEQAMLAVIDSLVGMDQLL